MENVNEKEKEDFNIEDVCHNKCQKDVEKGIPMREIVRNCEYREVHKSNIVVPEWLPREPKIISDADKDLRDSIGGSGLLNPLTVRDIGDGKFELLAGSRRFAAIPDTDTVWIHIKDNKSDYEARITCAIENYHRKDIDQIVRDDFYYQTYQKGIKECKLNNINDMANNISIPVNTLRGYIKAGEERAKNKNNDAINSASTSSLNKTRVLKNIPKVRNRLLEMEQQKVIQPKNITEMTKRIEACTKKGMTEKMITKMMDMAMSIDQTSVSNTSVPIDNNINNINNTCDANGANNVNCTNNDDNDEEKNTKIVTFNMDKFENISTVMALSHPDVREYIVSKKIDIKDAVEINRFETVEARRQLVEEKVKIDNWKKKSQETYDKEWEQNVDTRKQQVQDIKNNGDTKLKTKFDIDLQQKLILANSADDRHDEEFFRRYRNLQDQLNRTILYYHPKKVKTEKGKEAVNGIVTAMYEILRLVLIEIGEIKTGTVNDRGDGFGQHFVDIEAKVTEEG